MKDPFSQYLWFYQDYFTRFFLVAGVVAIVVTVVSLYVGFRLLKNPILRSRILLAIMGLSTSLWIFAVSSFLLCTALIEQYMLQELATVRLVAEVALIPSVVLGPLVVLVFRNRAAGKIYSTVQTEGVSVSQDSRVAEIFSSVARSSKVSNVVLRTFESEKGIGASSAMDWRGRRIVAISLEAIRSLSDAELEAVFAHEMAHIKYRDGFQKTFATAYRFAFPFDPIARLVEAAIYREREFAADEFSATITKKPLSLASALLKIHTFGKHSSAVSHPMVSSLVSSGRDRGLLSKQPSLSKRVERLISLAQKLGLLS